MLFVEDLTRTREQAQQLKLAALGRLTANIAHEIEEAGASLRVLEQSVDTSTSAGKR